MQKEVFKASFFVFNRYIAVSNLSDKRRILIL